MANRPNPRMGDALRLVDDKGMSIYAAAKAVGVPATSVYHAFARRKLKIFEARAAGVCEKCGAPVTAKGKYAPPPAGEKHRRR